MSKLKSLILLALWPVVWLVGRALYYWFAVLLTARSLRGRARDVARGVAIRTEMRRARAWHRLAGALRLLMLASPPCAARVTLARWSIHARRRGNELAFKQGQRALALRYSEMYRRGTRVA